MKENVDNISTLWLPDKDKCSAAEALREEKEWRRKKGGIMRPSELGIDNYIYSHPLHAKFFEGRTPPPVPLDSMENLEWYEEQLKRCVYGFEYRGQRITGDYYWFLNFTPFMVAKKDAKGNATTDFDINFPYFSSMHDYLFKLLEEAHYLGKYFMLMGGRGFGKTYVILSLLAKIYTLKPNSHGMVSASNSGHATEAFNKLRTMLDSIAEVHPTLNLARLSDTQSYIESGQEVTRDGVKYKEGPRSRLQKVIYGDNPGVTRGSRPDIQLMEEIGDWSSGKGSLKECIGASDGSWRVGSIQKCRVFMIGTGGSVSSDQARDLFLSPDVANILSVGDFTKRSGVFVPSHYMLGGMGWERTGVNNNGAAKKYLDEKRENTRDDMELHSKRVQEFPFTPEECFRKFGTNRFNQRKIADQWTKLHFEDKEQVPQRGFLEWIRDPKSNLVTGVKWSVNPEGNIEIKEQPYRGQDGVEAFPDLYVGGIDSIDQGIEDSTSTKGRSSLAMMVKKRIVDGQFFKQTSNIYVAKYIGRSLDVRWDYEECLKLTMYYNAKVNIEYTKIGIVSYFREHKQFHRLMKRPMVAMPSGGDGAIKMLGIETQTNLIGTPVTPNVIDHQDDKLKEYIEDYSNNIYFVDVLEQLRDYQREDRRKYDLVIAMGLCELADEDMLGVAARSQTTETEQLEAWGWYTDEYGYQQYGVLPAGMGNIFTETIAEPEPVRWLDSSGKLRFDDKFDILTEDDL